MNQLRFSSLKSFDYQKDESSNKSLMSSSMDTGMCSKIKLKIVKSNTSLIKQNESAVSSVEKCGFTLERSMSTNYANTKKNFSFGKNKIPLTNTNTPMENPASRNEVEQGTQQIGNTFKSFARHLMNKFPSSEIKSIDDMKCLMAVAKDTVTLSSQLACKKYTQEYDHATQIIMRAYSRLMSNEHFKWFKDAKKVEDRWEAQFKKIATKQYK
jgi:hypothetical protein